MKKIFAVLFCMLPAVAAAGTELDAYQTAWHPDPETDRPLGGDGAVTLGQTFVAEHTAPLVRVDLVVGCTDDGSGPVTVEIQGVDIDGTPDESNVLGSIDVDSADLISSEPAIWQFPIPGINLVDGDSYAVVIRGESTVDCTVPEGTTGGFGFAYPEGEAYTAEPAEKPEWSPVDFASGDDLAFWVYVNVADPVEPRHCDIADYSGLPHTWELPANLPICGCVSDSVLLHNRCWFSFPEWVVWRDIPFPGLDPKAKATWWVTPMNSDFPGLDILETDLEGFGLGDEVNFPAGLKPGDAHKDKVKYQVNYQGQTPGTLVNFEFDIDGQPASVQFETVIDIPQQN